MFKWVSSLLCGLVATWLVSAQAIEPAPGTVAIVSDAWEDYTGADGTGLGWDLMRLIFEPAGYKVVWRIEPYLRSVGLVQRGDADAWVGSYKDEQSCLYPRWRYDTDHIYALSLARLPAPTPAMLGEFRLAWVRGYEFQRYLPAVRQYEEIRRRDGILEMLKRGRADYYIDAEQEMDYIQQHAPDPAAYKMTHLIDLPLYLGFTDSPRGRELRDVFDRRMDELVATGQLRAIYKRWKMPYPFEHESTAKAP